tara:strand:- start:435 stop:602 length:168 start_codon:yes stop_codon:yes gene_type:complete
MRMRGHFKANAKMNAIDEDSTKMIAITETISNSVLFHISLADGETKCRDIGNLVL